MKSVKRNLTLTLLFLLPLVCVVAIFARYEAQAAQEQRNHLLRAALKTDNVGGVIYALSHGANPDSREVFRDKRTLWQKFREMFHSVPPNPDAPVPRAALVIALQRVLSNDEDAPREARYAIMKALHDAGATARGDAPQFALPPAASKKGQDACVWDDCLDAYFVADQLITDICADRAKRQQEEDNYATAVDNYRIAQIWKPNDHDIRDGLAKAIAYENVIKAVTRQRSDRWLVMQVRSVPDAKGHPLWAVLLSYSGDRYGYKALALYEEREGVFRLRNEIEVAVNYIAEFSVRRVTGRAAPEIVLLDSGNPGDVEPARLIVVEIRSGRLRTILYIEGDENPTLEDLRHDGHLEARCKYGGMVDGDVVLPVRSDIYVFNGDEFVLANREFPEIAQNYITKAEAYLAKRAKRAKVGTTRDDWDENAAKREDGNAPRVWYYLGDCYALIGQTDRAERCYQKAELFCRAAIALPTSDTRYDYDREYYQTLLKKIRRREPHLE